MDTMLLYIEKYYVSHLLSDCTGGGELGIFALFLIFFCKFEIWYQNKIPTDTDI